MGYDEIISYKNSYFSKIKTEKMKQYLEYESQFAEKQKEHPSRVHNNMNQILL